MEYCYLPNYNDVISFLQSKRTSEDYFESLSQVCDEFYNYFNNDGYYEVLCSTTKLNKMLTKSFDVINKMYEIFNFKFDFEYFKFENITYHSYYGFIDDNIIALSIELLNLLRKLCKKLRLFMRKNNLYICHYEFVCNINDGCYDINLSISKQIKKINKILEKEYIIDFFSDGSEEINEMCDCLYYSIYILCNIKKSMIKKYYSINNEVFEDINYFIGKELSNIYFNLFKCLQIDNFKSFSNDELIEKYEIIKKIDCLKEIGYNTNYFAIGKSEQELYNLIGLNSIKESIKKIKAYTIANKQNINNINLHMAFYGNPGTGKTEVARIIGNILFEIGILKSGHIVEVSRKDLVGHYVGETPILTQKCIEKAMGGVLFIDEAYSLVNDESHFDYGNEAISTLLKAMEDYRGQFCVIFAGYKNELENMISINPGLKSRIQFNLDFENYTRDELDQIFDLMIKKTKYSIEENAKERILDLLEYKKRDARFANAREVRNILEQVIMNANVRNPMETLINVDDIDKYLNYYNIKIPKNKKTNLILTGEQELDLLIGLKTVKDTIKKIRAFAKKNKDNSDFNLHMCFTGNPGTGKTEVARIISRILYEAGVLKEAKFIETNGNGLIGKYVGETGPKTQALVKDSFNGVLFIDEAYSLNSGNNFSYGQEAIATLLKEMEDNRGKFCVILAGYKNEMNELLAINPGFNSRIQFHIDFPDYTNEELRLIALKMINSINYQIEEKALDMLSNIVDSKRKEKSFANARTLRNVLDKVILNQNFRTEDTDDNMISEIDVIDYLNDNNLKLETNKSIIDLQSLYEQYNSFDTSIIDDIYLEQTVVSISGAGGEGTGFIISKEGLCLTCSHCIKNDGINQKARIIFNIGRKKIKTYFEFKVLLNDEFNDIALIKLNDQENEFDYLPLESPNYILKSLNEFIMAGFPFGGEAFENISITDGKIASENNYNGRDVVFANMFGKPGNSGSPILDKNSKKVIGIFWGGISRGNDMIHCFTSIKTILKLLKY